MRTILLLSLLLTLPAAAIAQQTPSNAASAADKFTLDVPAADAPAPAPAAPAAFSLDTPIADLIANAGAKAVLDRNLPGLSEDENLPKFQALSLRKFAPLTGGQLTAALLEKTAYDLAALSAGDAPAGPTSKKLPVGR